MRHLFVLFALALGCSSEPALVVDPASLSFGAVPLGATASATLSLQVGDDVGAVTTVVEPVAGPFTLGPGAATALQLGLDTTLSLRFSPQQEGDIVGVLRLLAEGATVEVVLTGEGLVGTIDGDRDGAPLGQDCDDADPTIGPAADELCDGQDGDCDGSVPPDELDDDADGVFPCQGDCDDHDDRVGPAFAELCDGLDGDCDGAVPVSEIDGDGDATAPCAGDCDDGDGAIHPGAAEGCDSIDTDCDNAAGALEIDADADGVLACAECDDGVSTTFPGAPELCDGVDQDCDGAPGTDEVDADSDGHLACAECDDGDPTRSPTASEACNGTDDDCDGAAGATEVDNDVDTVLACADCDDTDATISPLLPESCDGLDSDCDTIVPDDEQDLDLDGVAPCAGDCAEGDATTGPTSPELCDGLDQDCDGAPAPDEVDNDGDGQRACAECDDADPAVFVGAAEECWDSVDQDCDGVVNSGCTCPWWVTAGPAPCPPDGSFACPWTDLQTAVDAAAASVCADVVLLSGSHTGGVVISGTVNLSSVDGPDLCSVTGGGVQRALEIASGATVSVTGITVTAGIAEEGGGLRAESAVVTLDDVIVTSNLCGAGGYGGGMFCEDCALLVSDSTFSDNLCGYAMGDEDYDGGGLYLDGGIVTVEGSVFEGNVAGDGSALWSRTEDGLHTIQHNHFALNHAGDGDGDSNEIEGGTLVVDGGDHVVRNNIFVDNVADGGGGAIVIADQGPDLVVANNTILYNIAPDGAGIHLEFSWTGGTAQIVGNILALNMGFGMYAEGHYPSGFTHNALHLNTSGAWTSPWWWPGTVSNTNFAAQPGFVATSLDGNWLNEDLHLASGSACIDAGSTAVEWNDPDGSRQDVGAYGGPWGTGW